VADLTIAEAAKHLGINAETLRTRIRRGHVSAHKDPTGQWRVHVPEAASPAPPEPGQPGQVEPPEPGQNGHTETRASSAETIARLLTVIETMQRDHAREVQELHVLLQNAQRLIPATVPDAPHAPERSGDDESPHAEANVAPGGVQREFDPLQRVPPRRSWLARLLGWE